jgi:hypothetical protein
LQQKQATLPALPTTSSETSTGPASKEFKLLTLTLQSIQKIVAPTIAASLVYLTPVVHPAGEQCAQNINQFAPIEECTNQDELHFGYLSGGAPDSGYFVGNGNCGAYDYSFVD